MESISRKKSQKNDKMSYYFIKIKTFAIKKSSISDTDIDFNKVIQYSFSIHFYLFSIHFIPLVFIVFLQYSFYSFSIHYIPSVFILFL